MKQLLPRHRPALGQCAHLAADTPNQMPSIAPRPRFLASARPLSTSARRRAPAPPAAATATPTFVQAIPRGGYYDILLTDPPPYSSAQANEPPVTATAVLESKAPASEAAAPSTTASAANASRWKQGEAPAILAAQKAAQKFAEKKTVQERAALVFGSRLAGPMERANRLAEIRNRSTRIAGVLVPPKPKEPENCCMSGCVNCVWDRFRDEMEEWASANAEATQRLQAQEGGVMAGMKDSQPVVGAPESTQAPASSTSMDDDGGGSNTNWSSVDAKLAVGGASKGGWNEELYKGLPVGIREFMKQEKRLKMKNVEDGAGAAGS
ncbi:hypothetical protein SEPCBS119000_004053 [Sporothrix epigloea]|uniref:Oxidoreductase-like domain-containing protein n=1 Tax=Sporothrix epigloea TaxID=1892477 RepID=A0ABP0DPZ8_9PEZI